MQSEHKPRPFDEYQTRSNAALEEGDKYRGAVSCRYIAPSGRDPEYFDFTCDNLRDTPYEAMSDAIDLHHMLTVTPQPTVVLHGGFIYSLPTVKEHARATEWLASHDHVLDDFETEFPGARSANKGPLGGSSFGP
jgi:hypothetical protein